MENLWQMFQDLFFVYCFLFTRALTLENLWQIAFYRGNAHERSCLLQAFNKLEAHVRAIMQFRFGVGMVDTLVAKYMATVVRVAYVYMCVYVCIYMYIPIHIYTYIYLKKKQVGYYIVSRPLLDKANPKFINSSSNELQEVPKP